MNMKDVTPKKEVKDGKRIDKKQEDEKKGFHSKHSEKAFIWKYRYICLFCYILFRHTILL